MRARFSWAALGMLSLLVGAPQAQQPRPERGGPPAKFITEVPDHALSVIQCEQSQTGVTLSLIATRALKVHIESTAKAAPASVDLAAGVPAKVRITGLAPGKAVAYVAKFDGGEVRGQVRAPAVPGATFGFAIQADSHLDENSSAAVYERTLGQIASDQPDFLVDLGDTFMTGKHAKYEDAASQYRVQRYYMGLVGRSAPIFLVTGNHDGEQGWIERGQAGMASWSAAQRKACFPPPETGELVTGDTASANYYAFDWGDVQIVVLDPYTFTTTKPARTADGWLWTLGAKQYGWLRYALAKSQAKYRFVFIHHLVGGAGKDARGGAEAAPFFEWGGQNADRTAGFAANRPGWEAPIHDLLRKYGVDVVFHGHDHLYARQEHGGIVYQLVPQPSQARGDSVRSAEEYGYLSGKILPSSGHLRVSVSPARARVEYVKTSLGGGASTVADAYEVKAEPDARER